MLKTARDERRPGWGRLLMEGPAAARLLAAQLGAARVREDVGKARPVMVIPAFLANDMTTVQLRRTLRACGFQAYGWRQGLNLGARRGKFERLLRRIDIIAAETREPVALVGWSLGGLYAQELARAAPGSVRGLVTLGTPVVRWAPWVRTASGIVDGGTRLLRGAAALPRPWAERGSLRVPATSVYTRADGIVHWSSCRYEVRARRENVEVRGSHLGLACNPAVLWLLADRLGMAEGAWTPFRPRPD